MLHILFISLFNWSFFQYIVVYVLVYCFAQRHLKCLIILTVLSCNVTVMQVRLFPMQMSVLWVWLNTNLAAPNLLTGHNYITCCRCKSSLSHTSVEFEVFLIFYWVVLFKFKMVSSLTYPHVVTMNFTSLSSVEHNRSFVGRYWSNQAVLVTIDFQILLISQNILFYVLQKKVSHTCLKTT